MSVARRGLSPPPPNWPPLMTRSAVTDCVTRSSTDAFSEAANTVNRVTTLTPIIRAAADPDVRRGLRMALRRASTPVTPRSRASGAPMAALAGPATTGPATTTPTSVAMAPRPASPRVSPPPSRARSTMPTPAAAMTEPVTARTIDVPVLSTAVSRRAAMGAVREAFNAGARPDTTVTNSPMSPAANTPVASMASPPAGKENPKASNSPLSRPAISSPPPAPSSEATSPTTAVSASTDPRIWRRLAPSARSRADSRARWATMIEKVL